MSKVNIDEVESVLLQKKFDPSKVQDVVNDLQKIVEELAEERKANMADKQAWEYVIVLNDKDKLLEGKEIAGWVVQQHEGEDAARIVEKLESAANTQNEAAKRKKSRLSSLRDIFDGLKSKFLKEKKLRVKTKELTRVIITH
jgi:hypothetical protein